MRQKNIDLLKLEHITSWKNNLVRGNRRKFNNGTEILCALCKAIGYTSGIADAENYTTGAKSMSEGGSDLSNEAKLNNLRNFY